LVLLALFAVGVAAVVDARSDRVAPAPVSPGPPVVTTTPGPAEDCDFRPGTGACEEVPLEGRLTREGALERLRRGESIDADARWLLLDDDAWTAAFAPAHGPASFREGSSVTVTPLWEASLAGRGDAVFTWEQSWVLLDDRVLVEQLFVLADDDAATDFVAAHRVFMEGLGVVPLAATALFDGPVPPALAGDAPVLVFRDAEAARTAPGAACVARALARVDRVVFVVTVLSDVACADPGAQLAATAAARLADRATDRSR